MREYIMKKKKKKIETVRLITFDQVVIDVVGGTVSTRREILENFIVANNEMMTVVGGNSLSRLGKNLAAESYVLRINRGKSLWNGFRALRSSLTTTHQAMTFIAF